MPVDEVERSPGVTTTVSSYPLHEMAPVKAFVERPVLGDTIREQLTREADGRGGRPRKVGLWGLGGAGKSQLVLSYLQQYRDDYDATFWIQAGLPVSIDRDFLEIYRLLPNSASLRSQAPEDVREENFTDFSRYITNSPNIDVVFTSRSSSVEKLSTFNRVHVAELEEDQAVTLFFKHVAILRTRENTEDEVKSIVKELGCLVLAITIAASYVSENPRLERNLSEYLKEFRRRRKQLLDRFPDELTDKYDDSVMTVWETSYSAVYDQLPEACRVLTLLAFVHYEDIFLDLFGLRPDSSLSEATGAWTSRYSLVQRRPHADSYSIHRLVHAWDRDRLEAEKVEAFCLAAFEVLYRAVRHCGGTPEAKRRLVPHLKANFDEVIRLDIEAEEKAIEVIDVIELTGGFTTDIGSWGEAAAMKKEVLEKRQRILGDEHPDTISAMNNLANTLGDQGKLDEAVAMLKEVLEKMQRILGREHPHTLGSQIPHRPPTHPNPTPL
ncbi:P-loop containing nucleoside triphosphate hydrolase protein [Diplogelasinospora grovesii]|uniref:P-loop containing nucleoside triphosphate hydrolase protein n=1 Tax=Diplogelasinospora grovesii TaxID=303347 RepID=A0AAN6N5S6_9PEZI|nr:P-loop containing nucleoside triphosphate hydrolase protein [Diplogelasinospora grovesii]